MACGYDLCDACSMSGVRGNPPKGIRMRRLSRYIFDTFAVLSLLPCVGTRLLWIRSYSVVDGLVWSDGYDYTGFNFWEWSARTSHGGVGLTSFFHDQGRYLYSGPGWGFPKGRYVASYLFSTAHESSMTNPLRALGCRFGLDTRSVGQAGSGDFVERFKELEIPIPAVATLLAAFPLVRIRRWTHTRHAARPGCCRSCGYDLRATPERRPEFGMPVPAKRETT